MKNDWRFIKMPIHMKINSYLMFLASGLQFNISNFNNSLFQIQYLFHKNKLQYSLKRFWNEKECFTLTIKYVKLNINKSYFGISYYNITIHVIWQISYKSESLCFLIYDKRFFDVIFLSFWQVFVVTFSLTSFHQLIYVIQY